MSSQSSDDEAPQEISFTQAQTQALTRLQAGPAKKPASKKKARKRSERVQKIDPKVKAILEEGLDEEEERELARREAKFERSKVKTQKVALRSGRSAFEQKVGSNLKVICLKKVPVIPPSDKYAALKNNILHRPELSRKPLKPAK
jgi:hypothetical protein